MSASTTDTEELATFVRNALLRHTVASTVTIEHTTTNISGTQVLDRASLGPKTLGALQDALQSRTTCPPLSDGYLQAPAVARRLGIRTGTLAKWRRLGTGPNGWVRMNRTSVIYPIAEVEAFIGKRKKE